MLNNRDSIGKMNIFDSLFISLESPDDHINVVFEEIMRNEFIWGYRLPISKHTSIQMHLEIMRLKLNNSPDSIVTNRQVFDKMMSSEHTRNSFFLAHRNEVLHSPQLKAYLLEYKSVVETV